MQLNPSKPLAGIFVMFAFLYGMTILLTSDPVERIDRACAPVFVWPQRFFVAGAKIFDAQAVPGIEEHFNHGNAVCHEWLWNAFYSDELQKLKSEVGSQAQSTSSALSSATGGGQ